MQISIHSRCVGGQSPLLDLRTADFGSAARKWLQHRVCCLNEACLQRTRHHGVREQV